MHKQPSKDSFMSTLGKHVSATQLTAISVQPLHAECWEIYTMLEEDDEREPSLLASKKAFD